MSDTTNKVTTHELTINEDGSVSIDGVLIEGSIDATIEKLREKQNRKELLRRVHVVFCHGCISGEPDCVYDSVGSILAQHAEKNAIEALMGLRSNLRWAGDDDELVTIVQSAARGIN